MFQRLRRRQRLCALILLLSLSTALAQRWQAADGYRRAPLTMLKGGKPGFSLVTPERAGIAFTNLLSEERSLTNQIFLNGSGIAAGDVDGDGLCDLYFCGLDSANALYRNLGNWQFEDVTRSAGVACAEQASTGAVLVDVDGDGDLDLLVNGIGRGTRLFLNDGHAHFQEVTERSGLQARTGSMSLALADIDGDGLLDLYVVNYRKDTIRDLPDFNFRIGTTNGVPQLLSVNGHSASSPKVLGRFSLDANGGVLENGEADALFRNLGAGRFERVSWTNGGFRDEDGQAMPIPYDWGLSGMFHDINGDGAPDLYVCNDFQSPDRIWINDGHGTFHAIARGALQHTSLFSMGVDFADIDRDGFDDFFVADMRSRDWRQRQVQVLDSRIYEQARRAFPVRPQISHNTLFRNRGNGTFAEIAELSGVDASDWSWCPIFLDVDLDGYEDLLISTGHARDLQNADIAQAIADENRRRKLSLREQMELRRRFPPLKTRNAAFRNTGALRFEEVSSEWGFDSRHISHGMALADLDNDGDLDVIVNCLNDGPLLYRNDCTKPRLEVRLRGTVPNTRGVGARIRVLAPGLAMQSAEMHSGGRYLSSDDYVRSFAAGSETNLLTVEVAWRSGRKTMLNAIAANQLIEIEEPSGVRPAAAPNPVTEPFFENLSASLAHEHKDETFDDFARQPLLPRKLSDLGPGVTWFDFNGDGWDDLFVGTGRGGKLGVFRNDHGRLVRQGSKIVKEAAADTTTTLGWRPTPESATLLQGISAYEKNREAGLVLNELSLTTGFNTNLTCLPGPSTGPLAMADIDGDGDLDLFVGGRVVPGRYPEPAASVLLRNENGELRIDAKASAIFAQLGLASSASFVDLDNDGWPELVVACEWGPLRIYRNRGGTFQEWDAPITWSGTNVGPFSTLSAGAGLWNSIAVGDFDGDGRLDVVAGNWGRNNSRLRWLEKAGAIYYEAPPGRPAFGILEAHYEPTLGKYFPSRDWAALRGEFPAILGRYTNFTSFAAADLSEILNAGLPPLRERSIVTQDSIVLLNRGDHFEASALPVEAQFAPVFGLAVGDLDGDGTEDVFLTQNARGVPEGETPQDAGGALWLRGTGSGSFEVVSARVSGLSMQGDGRGAALCDFDHDGRLDLAGGQNRGLTCLYRNRGARPGLRIHLQGSKENVQAIGAIVRVNFKNGKSGPSHAVSLGGGYWSQDSTDIVLGLPLEPESIQIRWPGGRMETVPVPPGSSSITVPMKTR